MAKAASPIPSFTIPGIISEKRELKTNDGGKIWAYALKIMAMGGLYEVTTKDEALWKKHGDGEDVVVTGRFEFFKGNLQLVMRDITAAA